MSSTPSHTDPADSPVLQKWLALLTVLAVFLLFDLPAIRQPPTHRKTSGHGRSDGRRICRHSQKERVVRLKRVDGEDDTDKDVDIITIHGLDTNSDETWLWKPKEGGTPVNWITDSNMLQERFPTTRIFTCDWPAAMFDDLDLEQEPSKVMALQLLTGIQGRPGATISPTGHPRPVLFIASCLGGLLLVEALENATARYASVGEAARGFVFLATPFRGTSFANISDWVGPGLRAWAATNKKKLSQLMELVVPTFEQREHVASFTEFCTSDGRNLGGHIAIFYEKRKMSLVKKAFCWLPSWIAKKELLVDRASASLDIVRHPIGLDRVHGLMNKFRGPDDDAYKQVTDAMEHILDKIRYSPLARADNRLRTACYAQDKLSICRLNGEQLSIQVCYVNLEIVQGEAEEIDARALRSSASFYRTYNSSRAMSIWRGPKIPLSDIFSRNVDGMDICPRRIFICGRAGVGKTTLCKKIVYEFYHGDMLSSWKSMFDRVLWVPLRNFLLDERHSIPGYNMRNLLHDEFFSLPEDDSLDKAMYNELRKTESGSRTLFLLDGYDEVASALSGSILEFLYTLLDQPNVIATSRPHVSAPPHMHLTLETTGFSNAQVEEYVGIVSKSIQKCHDISTYLKEHAVMSELVQIPIQLDAMCYAWDILAEKNEKPKTVTAIYETIAQRLWTKDLAHDALRLQNPNTRNRTEKQVEAETFSTVQRWLRHEIALLQDLAFSTLHNNIIDFQPRHWDDVYDAFPELCETSIAVGETLSCLSFMRSTGSADSSSRTKNYHFLHLTYQEFFAAQYFVRQWLTNEPLVIITFGEGGDEPTTTKIQPVEFLHTHKYRQRYSVFWRFVAGLLKADVGNFFAALDDPNQRDVIGPVHHRLVVSCLSEASPTVGPEKTLLQWITTICDTEYGVLFTRTNELTDYMLAKLFDVATSEKMKLFITRCMKDALCRSKDLQKKIINWMKTTASEKAKYIYTNMFVESSSLPPCGWQENLLPVLSILSPDYVQRVTEYWDPDESAHEPFAKLLQNQQGHIRAAAVAFFAGQSFVSEEIHDTIVGLQMDSNELVQNEVGHYRSKHPQAGKVTAVPSWAMGLDGEFPRVVGSNKHSQSLSAGDTNSKERMTPDDSDASSQSKEKLEVGSADIEFFGMLSRSQPPPTHGKKNMPQACDAPLNFPRGNDAYVGRTAVGSLGQQLPSTPTGFRNKASELPAKDVQGLELFQGKHGRREIQHAFISALAGPFFDADVFQKNLTKMNIGNASMAAPTIGEHALPNEQSAQGRAEMVGKITACFLGKDDSVAQMAYDVLFDVSHIDSDNLRGLTRALRCNNTNRVDRALSILRKQPSLPSDVINQVANFLGNCPNSDRAGYILLAQPVLRLADLGQGRVRFCETLIKKSFDRHRTLSVRLDAHPCIATGDKTTQLSGTAEEIDVFRKAIEDARARWLESNYHDWLDRFYSGRACDEAIIQQFIAGGFSDCEINMSSVSGSVSDKSSGYVEGDASVKKSTDEWYSQRYMMGNGDLRGNYTDDAIW